jgi:hypothetical protein
MLYCCHQGKSRPSLMMRCSRIAGLFLGLIFISTCQERANPIVLETRIWSLRNYPDSAGSIRIDTIRFDSRGKKIYDAANRYSQALYRMDAALERIKWAASNESDFVISDLGLHIFERQSPETTSIPAHRAVVHISYPPSPIRSFAVIQDGLGLVEFRPFEGPVHRLKYIIEYRPDGSSDTVFTNVSEGDSAAISRYDRPLLF